MAVRRLWWAASVIVFTVLASGPSASAQAILDGRTAFENFDLARGNPPGNMVSNGFARAQATVDGALAQVLAPEITETESTSIRAQFLVTAIETVFDQLERTLLFLANRWLARAGLAPLLPPDLFFPSTGSGGANGADGDLDIGDLIDQMNGDTTPPGSDSTDSTDSGGSTDTDSTDDNGGRRPGRTGRG